MTAAGPPAQRGSELPFPSAVLAGRVRRVQARLRADGLAGTLLFLTFHVVPTVFDGGIGVCLSETVAVTARGVEVITRFPRDLVTV